jgi:hypothetical protein
MSDYNRSGSYVTKCVYFSFYTLRHAPRHAAPLTDTDSSSTLINTIHITFFSPGVLAFGRRLVFHLTAIGHVPVIRIEPTHDWLADFSVRQFVCKDPGAELLLLHFETYSDGGMVGESHSLEVYVF